MVTEQEMRKFDSFMEIIKKFNDCNVRGFLETVGECHLNWFKIGLNAFKDSDYKLSNKAMESAHYYEVLIACLHRELNKREGRV